jgi:uncharacterized coiled-coil protein SlyX
MTAPTVAQLAARLDEQTRKIETLEQSLSIQFTRIAQLQAQVDLLPNTQQPGEEQRGATTPIPTVHGNGHRPGRTNKIE